MNLSEIKKRVYALIEELNPDSEYLTDDVDYQAKNKLLHRLNTK